MCGMEQGPRDFHRMGSMQQNRETVVDCKYVKSVRLLAILFAPSHWESMASLTSQEKGNLLSNSSSAMGTFCLPTTCS